jgi:hypothetical protein
LANYPTLVKPVDIKLNEFHKPRYYINNALTQKDDLLCTLTETKIGRLVYANGQLGGTVVTITLLFTLITLLLSVCLPMHLEQTKSVCAIIYLYVKKIVLCLKR